MKKLAQKQWTPKYWLFPMIPTSNRRPTDKPKAHIEKVIPIIVPVTFTLGNKVGNCVLAGEKSRLLRRAHKTS
jgi:hypothetical protein